MGPVRVIAVAGLVGLLVLSPFRRSDGDERSNGHGRSHGHHRCDDDHGSVVPELAPGGAAAGLALIAGSLAVAAGRRRRETDDTKDSDRATSDTA